MRMLIEINGEKEDFLLSPDLDGVLTRAKPWALPALTIDRELTIRSTMETAALLGASRSTVFRWVKENKLPALQMDHRIRLVTDVTVPPRLCGRRGRQIVLTWLLVIGRVCALFS